MNKSIVDILYLESLRESKPTLFTDNLIAPIGELEGSKRERLFQALDALAEQPSRVSPTLTQLPSTQLPNSAPYGSVSCESKDCTLCMGCVAVCPTRALHHDGDSPSLNFIEQDCIQCGMCEKACPENALTLNPRFNWDKEARQSVQTLHQEKAAECIRCHKPFAPQSMITMLQDKLRGHSQFSNEQAINRIAMCEDCRVIDVFESMAEDPTEQLKY